MKATGEYVDGVVIGPKQLLRDQRFPFTLDHLGYPLARPG